MTNDKDKKKFTGGGLAEQTIRLNIKALNAAIWTYNNSLGLIGKGAAWLVGQDPKDAEIPAINEDEALENLATTGGIPFALGIAEEIIKFAARLAEKAAVGSPRLGALLRGGVMKVSHTIDRAKDACLQYTLGHLSWRMGELKDGLDGAKGEAAKANKKADDLGDKLDGVGNRVGNLEGEMEGLGDRTGTLEQGLGSVKEGLSEARADIQGLKSDLETQGKELRQAMGEMKSELQEQIEQQAELFDQKLQEQDTKFTEEVSRIDSEIAGLKGEMQAQKQQLRNEIHQKNEETKKQLRKEMESQKQELENQINELTRAQKEINQEVQEQIYELDEWINKVEQKTLQNATKIFEEKLERQTKDEELADAIKTTNLKLENLNQEKQDLADDFSKYQGKINQQTAQTQQDLESLETEYTRQTNSLNTKIATNQDRLDDYEEEQRNTKLEQKKLDLDFRELAEDTETNTHLIKEQITKLEFISRGMEEIAEETHEQINKLHTEIFDLEEQTEEALFTAKKAVRKVDNLTEELEKEKQRIKELEAQIEKNKQDTQSAKLEAELANLRLDNLLKSQELSDFTEQELIFSKLQKTLQLKADEAKLLAQLNLLQYSKSTAILEEQAEREWKVGIEEGTERQIPRPEGMPLVAGSRWEKKYSREELQEMGWDVRLQAENESAPLTTPEKRKPETTQTGGEQTQPEETKLNEELLTEIEQAKSKLLEQLAEIQERIGKNLETVENQPKSQPSEVEKEQLKANLTQLEKQEKELRQQRASTKAQLTKQTKTKQNTQKEISQLKSAITKETKKLEKTEQQLNQATNQNQDQQLQNQQQESQQKLTELHQELTQKQEQLTEQNQQTETLENQTETLTQQIQQTQSQVQQIQQTQASQPLEQAISQQTAQASQIQQQILEKEWTEVQDFQQEVLEDAPAPTPPPVAKLMEEEAAQAAAASSSASESSSAQEKQMTYFMLFLIIFLLEYIVYKRNGLPGLVILNICLAIAYYHKDTLMEYIDLWDKYVLIIGYVMGNVLAYSAPEQEKYKWPSVVGFNAIIALLYAYTWWQKRQINQQKEKQLTKIHEETKQKIQVASKTYEEKVEKAEKKHIEQQKQTLTKLDNLPKTQPKQLVLEVQLEQAQEAIHQVENTQEQEELKKEIVQIQQTLQEIKKTDLKSTVNIDLLEDQEPGIKSEWTRVKNWLKTINPEEQESKNTFSKLTSFIENFPLNEEETNLLTNLKLTPKQILAISCQSPRIKYRWEEIQTNYSKLTITQKLKLLNSGLETLGLKTTESKQNLINIRYQLSQEQQNFVLTTPEKENILRLLITNLNLNQEQRNSLEEMGVEFFNASNWQVSEEQKNQLLSFGLNKIELNEEQKQNLTIIHSDTFKTFAFTEPQKTILQSLAPLTKEFKYSKQLLEAIQSLKLKPAKLSFLVNEEVLPDLNTQFGETKSPYLPLKIKFLAGEKKVLGQVEKEQQAETNQEELAESKLSIVYSLMNFVNDTQESLNLNLTLDNWVKNKTLTNWQKDILLTCGFKTVPKYNFFELLSFSIKNFSNQTWAEFRQQNPELAEDYQAYLNALDQQAFNINEDLLDKFISSQTPQQKEIFKQLNLQELINEQINQRLAKYQFTPTPDYSSSKNLENWTNLSSEFTPELIQQWTQLDFTYQQTQEWLNVGLKPNDHDFAYWLKNIINLAPEEVLNSKNEPELREQFIEYQKTDFKPKPTITETNSPTSHYDDLLSNLNQEEAEHQKKKQQRQQFRQKLDQTNLSRRQANLSVKDRQLTEEQTHYQQELELEEQENQKRRQLRESREKELKEQEEKRLKAKAEQIEHNRNLAQQSLVTKQKEVVLEEARQKARIQTLEEQNKLEQERLQNQATLLEEQTKKKLELIALEDEEQRQQILKDQQKYQAELEMERLEQERNYQREKNTQELASQAREQQQKEELRRLELQLKKKEQRQLELALEKEKEIILNAAKFKKLNFQDFCNKFFDKSLENIMVYVLSLDFDCFLNYKAYGNDSLSSWFYKRKLTELFSYSPQGKFNLFKWVKNRPKVSPQEEETYKDLVFVPTRGLVPVSHYPYGQKYYPVYLSEKPYLQYTNDQRFLASLLGNNHFTIEEMKQILTSKCSSIEMIIEQLEILKSKENN